MSAVRSVNRFLVKAFTDIADGLDRAPTWAWALVLWWAAMFWMWVL
jgi:hypothetical protein